jgi:conserved hypothetical protein
MFVQDTKTDLINIPLPNKNCCKSAFQYASTFTCDSEVNTSNFVCDDCVKCFLRGVFLEYGTITNPDKSYHLELVMNDENITDSLMDLLSAYDMEPKKTTRKNSYVLYYKESERIVDFLNIIGANKSAFHIMNTKIRKELRNNANRHANCDAANIDKTVSASLNHIDAINTLIVTGGINDLPEELKETAYLRLDNPDITLSELAAIHNPPISKSGVNYRLKKLTDISKNGE